MRTTLVLALLALVVGALAPAAAQAPPEGGDDTVVVDPSAGTVAVAVALSQVTFPDGGADVVLIGRDDLFADSLASGVAQDEGPLLLVPTAGPVPAAVRAEIARLGASRAVLFGAEGAVSAAVAEELDGLGLAVERRAGASRTETAIAVAQADAPAATTAILARSGGVAGNATSAFADALAAGGWAAATGWPVLLTQTDVLTGSTRAFLEASSITDVKVMGGTAAVAESVVAELQSLGIAVERVAGPDRAATAVETAKARGAQTAAAVASAIVVDGFSEDAWAAGFAAAALSARGVPQGAAGSDAGAPIVLGNVDSLPPATADWLAPGPEVLTCAVSAHVCEQARLAVGFDAELRVEVPPGSVLYTVADTDSAAVWAADFDGTVRGLAVPCRSADCTQIDVTDDGDQLVVLHRQLPYLAVQGLVLDAERTIGADLTAGDLTYTSIDAMTEADGNDQAAVVRSDGWFARTRISQSGQGSSGSCQCARLASFQASAPYFVEPEGNTAFLVITDSGDLGLVVSGSADEVDLVDRRPGSQVLGAAWAPDRSGDIAIVDVVGGEGLLRIAPQGGEVVEVGGVDAASIPHWLAGGDVAVLADTADGVSLVVADPVTGEAEVVVDDAGDAVDGRISGDASGTFIAWGTATDVRVLDTRDGSVAVITPPSGMALVGGPVFRP